MMKKLCVGLLLLGFISQTSATVIFMDDFGSGSNAGNLTNIGPNWNVTAGSVDLWNFFSGQGYSVDLDGSGMNGTIESATAFNFMPGILYELSFSLSNNSNAGNQLNYSVGSLFSNTLPASSAGVPAFTTITQQFSVGVATSATIMFSEQGLGDFGGTIIDNVVLQNLDTVEVPEPSILASLCLGLAGLRLANRKGRHSPQ